MEQDYTRTFERRVGKRASTVIVRLSDLDIGHDLDEAARSVPRLIGLIGDLLRQQLYDREVLDANYLRWRAKQAETIRKEAKEKDWPKWQFDEAVKRINTEDRVREHALAVAEIKGDIIFLESYHKGLRAKWEMVKAMMFFRSREHTVEGTSVSADEDEGAARHHARKRSVARRREHVRNILKNKKKEGTRG